MPCEDLGGAESEAPTPGGLGTSGGTGSWVRTPWWDGVVREMLVLVEPSLGTRLPPAALPLASELQQRGWNGGNEKKM